MQFGRAIIGLLFAVALIALGGLVYQAGVVAGAAGQVANPATYAPVYGYGWHGGGLGFFGFFGMLILFFLIVGLFKSLLFGGMHRMHGGYWRGQYMGDVPPWQGRAKEMHDEWHRQGGQTNQSGQTPSATQ